MALEEAEREKQLEKFWCPSCYTQNEIGTDNCIKCGFRLTPTAEDIEIREKLENHTLYQFNGIYRYGYYGKTEVSCPRCHSENCSYYQEQVYIPEKTKTRLTVNLNPFRPFTIANVKEKVVRQAQTITKEKFICNACGKIFE